MEARQGVNIKARPKGGGGGLRGVTCASAKQKRRSVPSCCPIAAQCVRVCVCVGVYVLIRV